MNNILESKLFRAVVLSIAVLIILVFVFGLGVFVGTKKADFSFKWADQYHRNFGGPPKGFFGDIAGEQFINSNGIFGQILKIDGQTLTIKGKNNMEISILVTDKTSIVRQRNSIKLSDLKLDDIVVIIGDPNDNGQVEAMLIRVLPPSPISFRKNINKLDNF